MKSFPKPSQIEVPAGAEGWEKLYPYNLVFENAPGGDEKFWFCDSQHWPTVSRPSRPSEASSRSSVSASTTPATCSSRRRTASSSRSTSAICT
ncbi:hypothetical protein SHIRM173S_12441 [Streptomyces hirsutus]